MPRALKKTRIRGLPPKVLLSKRQDASGSFPTVWRTCVDNRTGNYPTFFNDDKTIRFNTFINIHTMTPNVHYPLVMTAEAMSGGLSPEDLYELNSTCSNPIITSGDMPRGVSDYFVASTPGQDLQPWRDQNPSPEVMGKTNRNPFYMTGSLVQDAGPGFDQPVWSKNKIVIDLTPREEQTFTLRHKHATEPNYPMAYWSPEHGMWEALGGGHGLQDYDIGNSLCCFEEQYVAFTPSADNGGIDAEAIAQFNFKGRPLSNFGFPYHPKFQPTSSQQIVLSKYLAEPFLLEKIVVELSASLLEALLSPDPSTSPLAPMWTFFVGNVRRSISGSLGPVQYGFIQTVTTASAKWPYVTQSNISSTVLDLVDYTQAVFTPNPPLDVLVADRGMVLVPSFKRWTGQLALSSSAKSPIRYSGSSVELSGALDDDPTADRSYYKVYLSQSNRNQIYDTSGRDWRNTFTSPVLSKSMVLTEDDMLTDIPVSYTKVNPYVLYPTDKLVFGAQNPTISAPGQSWSSSSMTFCVGGINKLILYGSTLRLSEETNRLEEYHEDTLNQLLSSEAIHEEL